MQFKYIDENLDKIFQNLENILYIRPYNIGSKRALFAMIKIDQGIYQKIQLTEEQDKGDFPFDPLLYFYNGPGYIYLKNFIILHNWLALNTINLEGFRYKVLDEKKILNVEVDATFNDGTATFVIRDNEKKFNKKGGIKSYIELLEQYKEHEPKHEHYQNIENYNNGNDTFIIPELQVNTEENSKVRKLIIKKNN